MLSDFGFADVLFILLVGGVIYFFVYWFGPVRKTRSTQTKENKRPDSQF
jgi:hypothetical protein